ncbi:NAD(P)-binding protein [Coniochaeta ligniaria NRRL 30616]|uniref:NAD(P)-binding protein n=1 Tax=Coniochaeta ligniaria NRRL 30616 TaxID=1408157 RepID=A0A1J7IWD3_9PEZI|nr:NAD(P)-binding protein [Coniochaeta ligniaria NRRL 30616]
MPSILSDGSNGESASSKSRILRVGIIGCGEVAQVIHIPTLNHLSHRYRITYLCDVSHQALEHCAKKIPGAAPSTTTDAEELCSSPDVDVVLICNANAYHVEHGILALKHGKDCLIEKPLALNFRDVDRIVEAEKSSRGNVFVGTMRRYATAFLDAVEEVGSLDKVLYARVRDIVGPNSGFVAQSGTYPAKFSDFPEAATQDLARRDAAMEEQALGNEFGVPVTPRSRRMLRLLGGLGTHDLSAMREIVGMPQSVAGAVLTFPGIFAVLFQYDGFPVTYESGFTGVPEFDANIEVYSQDKIIRVNYDTPYVKGLPVTMTVRERVGEAGWQERTIRKTYEDPYTLQFLELYDCVVEGRTPKTGAADAKKDVELFQMILRAGAETYKAEAAAASQ